LHHWRGRRSSPPLSDCYGAIRVNKTVLKLPRSAIDAHGLPPSLAETLPYLPELSVGRSFAVVCSGTSCQPPVYEAEALIELLNRLLESSGERGQSKSQVKT
jgi:hypothetical protein